MTLLVFTDLDGSLMEHESYSIEAARPALDELAARQIPLILNSSKSAAEMTAIQEQLELRYPFICENGAALFRPNEETIEFATPRELWLERVHALRDRFSYSFQGFTDWTASEISTLTGLSKTQAEQAKDRCYSEPILWRDSEASLHKFHTQLEAMQLRLLQGGRFQSIQGMYDKSDALRWMVSKETEQNPESVLHTIALGDSPNDAAMLNASDIAVIIKSGKSNQILCPDARQLIHTKIPGPAGWNEALLEILSLYDAGQLKKA